MAVLLAPVKPLTIIVGVLSAVLVPSIAFPTLAIDPAPPPLNPPLVGFSFSPAAVTDGSDPQQALARLLRTLQPDLVRLPVYWSTVAPTETTLDYTEVDGLIETVEAHNAVKGARRTEVVLVVGARNLVYPEVHLPGWLDTSKIHKLETLLKTASYRRYLDTTFRRYASLPVLRAWQVENEPLDNATIDQVTSGTLPASMIRSEVDLLRSIDLVHEVVVTTFNSSHVTLDVRAASPIAWLYAHLPGAKSAGHPSQALTMGDTLGLDLYVVTDSTPLDTNSASTRIAWKEESLDYWQSQASKNGRALWVTEMQATPWIGTTGFTTSDLLSSALAYRGHGVSVYLLWGVEDWLDSPAWMTAGVTAVKLLRHGK
ncbi:MAG TPA: hypothetical protein VG104_04210 [Candidatus Dormibacteraeota bacterium]|nr:hypothetical protein [Candidatus Dormibacteraeota bacterium]